MAQIGYFRVSTTDQHLDRQLADIRSSLDKTFEDKTSGKNTQRPGFQAMMAYLREGDTLHVHEISRLCRNTADLLATVDGLTAKGVKIHFHKENLITGDNSPMGNLMITLLAGIAQMEREFLLERQREGYTAARAAGRVPGRGKSRSINREGIVQALAAGGSIRNIASTFGVSTRTVQNIKRDGV